MRNFLIVFALLFLVAGCSSEGNEVSTEPVLVSQPSVQPSCPNGMVDDPYPGSCGRYVDANKDGFCDLGEQ
ncbi:MAG: hypothetical protein V1906_02440 [Candidatus Woesearchaeota archaeon]